jgi:cytochrome c peroxidase
MQGRQRLPLAALGWVLALAALSGCGSGDGQAADDATAAADTALSPAAQLGKQLLSDNSLSASGRESCITCHSPSYAYATDPANSDGLPVPLGGVEMDLPGFRNAPSLMYASFTPPFSIAAGNTPTGGFFRDGRASSLAVQAEQPFVSYFEMANGSASELLSRLVASPISLSMFEQVYGASVLGNPEAVLADMGEAIAAYETEGREFHPFSSKYDYWLLGQAQLTAQEKRGLTLFNDPAKGNCTACHESQVGSYSNHPLFTDFTYDNIGVPRNWAIPANTTGPVSPVDGVSLLPYMPAPVNVPADAEYAYYDLGLCGPFSASASDPNPRPDLSGTTGLCGMFKVPTLRNVAITAPYFHNGVFSTLKQVIEWYVTRDINNAGGNNPDPAPAGAGGNPYQAVGTFYTAEDGSPDLYEYNDLPVRYDANVNIGEVPYTPPTFEGGQAPTLSEQDINDVVTFLCTLTDGYQPANPQAYTLPAQCQAAEATAAAAAQR